ncbi:MAG: NblA/ycf18 family protein [Xenococcaceae cyanobacterium]
MEFLSIELTLEQQFQMKLMQKSAKNMSREQALDLLIQASRLLMIKDNVIRQLIKEVMSHETSTYSRPKIYLSSS